MKQQAGKFYVYAVPLLLFSLRMAVFICAEDAAKENAIITLNSPATAHTAVLPRVVTTPEPWHPFVAQIPAKEKAKEGETVVLNCQFHSPWGPSLSKLTVKWYKVDEKGQRDLLENNVTVLTNYSRAFIYGNLSQGDASLTILNVTASDHGIYFCQVTLSSGKVVMGSGTKLRIRRALGLFGIEESIGTIIGVVAAGIGGLVVLIIVLTPRLRKCLLCIKQAPHQDKPTLDVTACVDTAYHSPTKNLEGLPCPQTPTQSIA